MFEAKSAYLSFHLHCNLYGNSCTSFPVPVPPFQVCTKVFGNASALAKHKLTHSNERKYVCGMCSKAFKRQDHL